MLWCAPSYRKMWEPDVWNSTDVSPHEHACRRELLHLVWAHVQFYSDLWQRFFNLSSWNKNSIFSNSVVQRYIQGDEGQAGKRWHQRQKKSFFQWLLCITHQWSNLKIGANRKKKIWPQRKCCSVDAVRKGGNHRVTHHIILLHYMADQFSMHCFTGRLFLQFWTVSG